MPAGRKPGTSESAQEPAAVDPRAPTRASVPAEKTPAQRPVVRVASGAFTPDAPTKIFPSTPSLEDAPLPYDTHAPTQAMNVGGIPDEDPFASRATEAELPSFSSRDAEAEAEGPSVDELEDSTRLDLRRPGGPETELVPLPGFDDDIELDEVVDISLSDMELVPEISPDEPDDDTQDTVVNVPLPPSLLASPPPAEPAPPRPPVPSLTDPLPIATVVERRSHNPAALFDEDTASVTDPRDDEGSPAPSVSTPPPLPADRDGEEAETRVLASDRTAARPSLVSQPSGAPAPSHSKSPVQDAAEVDANVDDAPAYWDEASLPEQDEDEDEDEEPLASVPGDASEEGPLPALHKWKVVPTALRDLDRLKPAHAQPPAAGAGFGPSERPKTLHTMLWSPDDEAAAREEHADRRRNQNPFWAPTDARASVDDDDDPLESTEAPAPEDPRHASAAYIHDAIAYLRSASHFGAHLNDELRKDFETRMLGANEKLRRALTVLHSAFEDSFDDDES